MNSNQQYVDQNYANTAQPSMQAQTMAQPNMQPQGMEQASMAQPSMAQPSMQAQSMEQVSMQTQTTAQPGIENNVEQTKKPTSVFVTVTRYPEKDQTFVGFGSLTPHEKNKEIGAKDAFHKLQAIDSFLKALDANQIPLNIKGRNKDGKDMFMKADCYVNSGVSKNGDSYYLRKIAIEVQREVRNEAGEVIQAAQKLYATKGDNGYAFDKNCDPAIKAKFNESIKEGASFSLAATKNDTLAKYQNLTNFINQVDRPVSVELNFQKGVGVSIDKVVALETKEHNNTQNIVQMIQQPQSAGMSMSR